MPSKFLCDICDSFLTHDSQKGRRQHNYGFKHRDNYRQFWQKVIHERAAASRNHYGGPPPLGPRPPGFHGGPLPPPGFAPFPPGFGGQPPPGFFGPPGYGPPPAMGHGMPPPWMGPPGGPQPPAGSGWVPPPGWAGQTPLGWMPPPGAPRAPAMQLPPPGVVVAGVAEGAAHGASLPVPVLQAADNDAIAEATLAVAAVPLVGEGTTAAVTAAAPMVEEPTAAGQPGGGEQGSSE